MPRRSSGRMLFAGFFAVVLSFIGARVYQRHAAEAIDTAARVVADDAGPAIEHLAALRGEVRQTEFLLDEWVDAQASGRQVDRMPLENSIALLVREEHAFQRLPRHEQDSVLAGNLEARSVEFYRSIEHAMGLADAGASGRAAELVAGTVRERAEALIDVAVQAIDANARLGSDQAHEIELIRHHLFTYGIALDVLCALFAVLTAFLLVRQLHRTDALRAQHERLLERRAEELESFAGRVAHDILSPLAAVRLALTLGARGADEQAKQLLTRGGRALTRVENLTDDLLQFARAAALPAPGSRAEVAPVVEGVLDEVREAASSAGVRLSSDPGAPGASVGCSAGILTSVLSNLVRNAVKYIGDGPRREVRVRVVSRGARLRLEVEDTGPGIAAEHLARIFQPWVRGPTAGQPGLGLGLATVKRLAESHGGTVGVTSREGEGSLFWVELPAAESAPESADAPALMH